MKLWEIKAQALRLMFADSDINFSETEFTDESIYSNPNTRDKLVRMEDSICRAIDLFYQYCGNISQTTLLQLKYNESEEEYENILETSGITNFGIPSRIDIIADSSAGIYAVENVSFNFDVITKEIFFTDADYAYSYSSVIADLKFLVFYKLAPQNLPANPDQMTYDLSVLNIPEDIQRQIPLYVKGELYEEDENILAGAAKAEYIKYLVLNQRRTYSKKQTKVKNKYPRSVA